jgi:anthraniloyl-CoA monooxygenase
MRIACLGGGPAGLYFAILMKQAYPDSRITVFERNRAGDTFGWGVVFSDDTLSNFEEADAPTYAEIRRNFAYWGDIDTWFGGRWVRSSGHGFCGMSRRKLLQIFHARCRELGIELNFEQEIASCDALTGYDLILASDGIQSAVRKQFEPHFRPSLDWRKAKFCWLGTDKPLSAFTFIFLETEWGVFQVHAYPFEKNLSTWIVECHESTWKKAGLDTADEARTLEFCTRIFAPHLEGHKLLANRSIWRTFPTVRCEKWHHGNIVLVGDAVHTAHFSIGSGTKLAMEDSIALVQAFRELGTSDVPRVLEAYERSRKLDVLKTQRAAQTSLEWFENSARYMRQHPLVFSFNLMTRSKRITYENLKKRDPKLVREVTEHFADSRGIPREPDGRAREPFLVPLQLRQTRLENRIVVSPMCQYSAVEGTVSDWHLVHLGSRAVGGAGLVIAEMTDVSPEGRITHGCAGLWNDAHEAAWKRICDFVHTHSRAKLGVQLAHAGRKASCELPWEGDRPLRDSRAWQAIAPSATPFAPDWPIPREMTRVDMDRIRDAFVESTRRALRAGFDLVELHMAHGYLLSSFLSPFSNRRTDEYGGSRDNRMRFSLEVFRAVRAVWPSEKPLAVRISATDWLDERGGWSMPDSIALGLELEALGCDLLDVSSAGNTPESKPVYGRMYQVPFAEELKLNLRIPVMAVGGIQGVDHANTILAAERADLCALARPHLAEPYLTQTAAGQSGSASFSWPVQYLAARPRPGAPTE